jgi:hypothetical protein
MSKIFNILKGWLIMATLFFRIETKRIKEARNRVWVKNQRLTWFQLDLETGDVEPVKLTEKDGRKFFIKQAGFIYVKALNTETAFNKFLKLSKTL